MSNRDVEVFEDESDDEDASEAELVSLCENVTGDSPLFNKKQEEAITNFFGSDFLSSVKNLAELFITNSSNYAKPREELDVEFDVDVDVDVYLEKAEIQSQLPFFQGENTFYQLVDLLKCTPAKGSVSSIDWYRNIWESAITLEKELKLTKGWPYIARILGAIILAAPGAIYGAKGGTAVGAAIGGGVGSVPAALLGSIVGGLIGLGFGLWSGNKAGQWASPWRSSIIAKANYSASIAEIVNGPEIETTENEAAQSLPRWGR